MSVLRQWFGPSKAEVWQQLADQVGGSFVDGGFFGTDQVVVTHGEWTVVLDTYQESSGKSSTTCTRMRAPYVNADHFQMQVYREGLFSQVGKLAGLMDVEVGDEAFDDRWVVKGNDEKMLRAFFRNPRIRASLQTLDRVRFEVKDHEGLFSDTPPGVDVLSCTRLGVLKDLEQLHALFTLFAESLDQLCRIGAAYEHDPDDADRAPPVDDGRGVAMGEAAARLEKSGSEGGASGSPVALPVLPGLGDDER